jgi:hypothetical protein
MAKQSKLQTFILYAPDKTDPGTHDRRLVVRGQYLDRAKEMASSGLLCEFSEDINQGPKF